MKSLRLLLALFVVTTPAFSGRLPEPTEPAGGQPRAGDLWLETPRVERGAEMLAKIYASHGGVEAWQALEGVRFDLLETWRVLVDRRKKEFKVHHRTPRLCWFDLGGNGFVRSEYVRPDGFTPDYRRDVAQGNYAWAETGGQFLRVPSAAAQARAQVQRMHFFGTFPFSLHERGGELIFLKDLTESEDGSAATSLYGVRLAKPVILGKEEELTDLAVIVDNATSQIVQIQYSFFGRDRLTVDKSTECFVDFEYGNQLGELLLPAKYFWFFELDARIEEFWIMDLRDAAVPPASLRRPWQSGSLYETDERADEWDPPAEEPAPVDEQPADGGTEQ